MNGYERITTALKGEKPDKVPVMLHNFMMAARERGITMKQYRYDPKLIAESFIASVEKYGYDGILVDIDTATIAGAAGVPVDFPVDAPARAHKGNLGNLESAVDLKPVNPEDYKYIRVWLEAVRLLKDHFGNEIYIRGNCDQAPFSLAGMMRGVQNWMLDIMTAPDEQLEILLNYCTGTCSRFIRLMAQTGCDMVSNGDSPAGPEMVSPEIYLKFAMPYERAMAEAAHNAGTAYTLHICGNTDVILEHLLLTGADAFELDYKTDITKIYNTFHDSVTFIGNIDPAGVLAFGTVSDVQRKTLELLHAYEGSSRFILNAGCAIAPDTPAENIRMMIETARNFR